MNDLVIMKNQQALTTSLKVASTFNKRPDHVLRDIDTLKKDAPNFGEMFFEDKVKDSYGRSRRMYYMNRDGFSLLAMGFTGRKALKFKLKYINAFNQMEAYIKANPVQKVLTKFPIPKTYGEALQLAADRQVQLEKQKPKIDYYNSQMRNPGLMTTTEIAKDYGWSAQQLNKELHKFHVIFKQGKHWVIYQKFADKGYTQYEPFPYEKGNGIQGMKNNLKWTQRGKKFIYDLLAKNNIYPTLEQLSLLEM